MKDLPMNKDEAVKVVKTPTASDEAECDAMLSRVADEWKDWQLVNPVEQVIAGWLDQLTEHSTVAPDDAEDLLLRMIAYVESVRVPTAPVQAESSK